MEVEDRQGTKWAAENIKKYKKDKSVRAWREKKGKAKKKTDI